jgi:PPK2 family polyphosphate:nucleotide phosphotransferase
MAKAPGKIVERYRVDSGKHFRLKDFDPDDTGGLDEDYKDEADALLRAGMEELRDLQDKLYAQDRWAALLIFQAMDAAGKDGTIKHVFSGVNPQGCVVHSFKAPSDQELDHDYLWRASIRLPERGHIGIFNRSYYEEVLVVRVHPQLLERQHLPAQLVGKDVWKKRYKDIESYERYLTRNGVVIRKFFLHLSRGEQRRRFLARLEDAEKNWKFSTRDIEERKYWKEYQDAYEDAIRATADRHAPWYVIPADHKWFTRLMVGAAVVEALKELDLAYPKPAPAERSALRKARRELLAQEKRKTEK